LVIAAALPPRLPAITHNLVLALYEPHRVRDISFALDHYSAGTEERVTLQAIRAAAQLPDIKTSIDYQFSGLSCLFGHDAPPPFFLSLPCGLPVRYNLCRSGAFILVEL